jgi:dipeptidyl aminopeptidase/acylaminoacyl peptidase
MKNSRYSFICLLWLTCGLLLTSWAQNKRPMTATDLLELKRASDVQLAPDGRRVAFVVSSWERAADRFNTDLWTATADVGGSAQRLTFNARRDDQPRWSPDGQHLAFLSERTEASAGKSALQLYLINPQGGEAQPLTSHATVIQTFEWSPDGRFIAFIAEVPLAETSGKPQAKRPIVVDEEPRFAQLWLLEVATRQVRQFTKGARHITALNWSADSKQLALTARATPKLEDADTTEVFLLPVPGAPEGERAPVELAQARQLTHNHDAESEPRFSPDGRWLAWLAHAAGEPNEVPGVGPERLHLLPLQTADAVPRVLARNFAGYIRGYRWLYNSSQLIFRADLGVYAQLFNVDLSDRPPQAMTRGEGVCGAFAVSSDGLQLVYTVEHPRLASEVASLNARTLLPVQLSLLNPQIGDFQLGQVETIRWPAPPDSQPGGTVGGEIEGLLFYPVGYESGKRYPLMTYIHGGPESAVIRNFNASWGSPAQVLAGQGYAVFMPNFRGSSNYGAQFAQANTLKAGQVDAADVMSGIDFLIKRGLADENRLAIGGWSYGGYLSGWLIGQTNRFKCAVYGAGLSNAVSYWGTADITYQRERLHGGTPWTARQMFDAQSPLTHLSKARTPTLIFHGEKDDRVPLGQSQESYRTLKRLGVPVKLVIYPDQGHGLQVPSYQLDKLQRELAWLEAYLGAHKM